MENKKLYITDTILRDAHQSQAATRMRLEDMLPACEELDKAGYWSLECWGGATFDSCMRFLKEDPWERLRQLRKAMPNTKLQMLLRGQNLLGYKHYADDVVDAFVKKSIENGINVIRIFDALNDPRNMEAAIKATKKYGGHVEAAISYTTSPAHSNKGFAQYAKQLEEMGADSICIKDMAGLLTPYNAYELVTMLKKKVKVPIELHTHYTSGLGSMTLLKAIEAGVDIVDTAISPMALGTSQPPTEAIVATLAGTEYDTGLDLNELDKVCKHFMPLREKYMKDGLLDPKVLKVDVNALIYQVPGGMLSNLVSQLKQAGKSELLDEVLAEVPRVRADAGYPPLVTPSSQIVGTQAVFNVLAGERYKMCTKEFKGLVRGEYGKTPVKIDPAFVKQILGGEKPINYRPADDLKPELETLREKVKPWAIQDEDVLSYALFEQVAVKFFEARKNAMYNIDSANADFNKKVHTV